MLEIASGRKSTFAHGRQVIMESLTCYTIHLAENVHFVPRSDLARRRHLPEYVLRRWKLSVLTIGPPDWRFQCQLPSSANSQKSNLVMRLALFFDFHSEDSIGCVGCCGNATIARGGVDAN